MKYIKTFENSKLLTDMPYFTGPIKSKGQASDFKYKEGDIVKFKDSNTHYIIKNINYLSNRQDYYIFNPLNKIDKGWVVEEELSEPDTTSENYEELIIKINTEKFNL